MYRRSTHAGTWYSDDKTELLNQINKWTSNENNDFLNVKGIIVPHAGYRFCGKTSGKAFSSIKNHVYKNIFILGPLHHYRTHCCLLSSVDYYKTPVTNLYINKSITKELYKSRYFKYIDIDEEEYEHSIEMELPFISALLDSQHNDIHNENENDNKISIIPIYCGQLDESFYQLYSQILLPFFNDSSSLFVISSDFTHWGNRFNYTRIVDPTIPIYKDIQNEDEVASHCIQRHDYDNFVDMIKDTSITICGRHCISIYLKLIQLSSTKLITKQCYYDSSSKIETLYDSGVSYCSLMTYVNENE